MKMKHWRRAAVGASSLAVLLALGACGDRVENTEKPMAQEANVEINRQGMDGAKASKEAAGVDNEGAVRLGVGDTSVMDPDVRIAERVRAALAANPDFGALAIDVHSEDGDVTLRGQAPDPVARDRATEIARSIGEVRSVDNQITVG